MMSCINRNLKNWIEKEIRNGGNSGFKNNKQLRYTHSQQSNDSCIFTYN